MTVVYEIDKSRTGEPTVNKQIFKRDLCLDGASDHFNEFRSLAYEIFLLAFGCMRVLVPLPVITDLSLPCT